MIGSGHDRAGSPKVLWLINQYFWPDVAAAAQLLADLGEDAAAAGWDVRALAGTAPYVPGGPASARRLERWRGVRIEHVAAWSGLGAGAMSYAGFLLQALLRVLRVRRGDMVVAPSTPPFVALVGVVARLRGARGWARDGEEGGEGGPLQAAGGASIQGQVAFGARRGRRVRRLGSLPEFLLDDDEGELGRARPQGFSLFASPAVSGGGSAADGAAGPVPGAPGDQPGTAFAAQGRAVRVRAADAVAGRDDGGGV